MGSFRGVVGEVRCAESEPAVERELSFFVPMSFLLGRTHGSEIRPQKTGEQTANTLVKKNTRHIISTPEFAKMKKGVIIINTARGAVMDEDALVKALESGQVSSVGLDVFEEEPKVHPGLLKNPNVMLLPHLGTYTVETMEKMEAWTLENIGSAIAEGRLLSIVPEQADL